MIKSCLRIFGIAVAALAGDIALAQAQAIKGDPIKIGAVLSLTGPSASTSESLAKAYLGGH
jgi:hypothetical protein